MTAMERVVFVLLVLAVGGGAYWWWRSQQLPPLPETTVTAPAPAPVAPENTPEIQHPIEEAPVAANTEAPKPLPPLPESDPTATEALAGVFPGHRLPEFLITKSLVRHIVATVDNLPRNKVSMNLWPLKPVGGTFDVAPTPDGPVIAPDNAGRYAPYVRWMETIDAHKLAATYVRLYPLFQSAYRELGYPKGYFNDRAVAVIDHLLATPDVPGAVRVEQPKVLYEYADPVLKSTSAGQQILLRMGHENAQKVKAKLRELRKEITQQVPKG
jgi:Protein of unknown function (DUF3014)